MNHLEEAQDHLTMRGATTRQSTLALAHAVVALVQRIDKLTQPFEGIEAASKGELRVAATVWGNDL